ncbi:myoferlin-like isoform X1 [Centruroides vittatus]|uniref:myoferlin-like isoform X1 n=1 Tax=Centruroides vittatus TaxID=120091 RepID=UPI00350FB198
MKRLSHNVYTLESQKQVEAENEENEGREEKDKDQKNAVEVLHHHAGVKSNRKEKYQVRVKIIEGRQLSGANINPVCKVSLHGVSKQTRVVKSSVNPWWDEIFFFHLETSPADLYSETIDFHVNNARAFRSNTLLGSFKLDLGIIYEQPEHVFLNKWLLLGSTDDTVSRAMGYLKFSAVVLGPGDECPNLATPEHKEDDDVESNLLLASGVQLKPASFIIDVYQAIDLPQMDSSVTDGVKKMLHVERKKDLVDPYLAVVFAGHKVQSTIIHGKDHPEWNERIFLDFQFPSMCEKIKLVLTDWDRLTEDDIIATYLMSINHISAPGEYGYLPTYGPAWVNFYGSPREYTDLNNGCDGLNKGIGEGCSYRGRALLSLRTNLGSFSEVKSVPVEKTELLQVMPYCRRRKYRLHAAFIDASMVSVIDTPVEFEVSIGNFGNKFEETLTPSPSTTQPTNAAYDGCNYYYLPWKEVKPCVIVTSQWEDIAFRLETVNLITKVIDNLEQHIKTIQKDMKTRKPLPELAVQFIYMMDDLLKDLDFKLPEPIPGQHIANELDNQLRQLRNEELRNIKKRAAELREKATDIEEAMSETEGYLKMLQSLCVETQNSIPDVVIWMLSGKKRVAYCRIPTHQILFSPDLERCGKYCGKLQSVMLKYPILEASSIDGGDSMKNSKSFSKYWKVPALLRIKLWFGLEVYDVFWSTSQTDAEMSVFAETYENQVNVFGKWTTSGPAMTRPAWSDASGSIALPQENFISPYGWKFDGDWFISPEPSMMYDDEVFHRVCTDEIYENESRMPGGPWGPALFPWTDLSGEATVAKNEVQIPSGWIWETNWEIDLNRAVDEDGWEYTAEMEESGFQPVEMTLHLRRRRRWIRQRACLRGISDYFSEKDFDTISISSVDSQVTEEGWEYAPLFNMKFHAKERRMDLVRRRRWHRKLIAEDPSAPLVFNLAITPKKTSIVRKIMGSEASTSESKQTVEDAKLAMLSCPRLYLIYKHAHKFQLRAYVYQARDLIASDRSGFSDPYICVSCFESKYENCHHFPKSLPDMGPDFNI